MSVTIIHAAVVDVPLAVKAYVKLLLAQSIQVQHVGGSYRYLPYRRYTI